MQNITLKKLKNAYCDAIGLALTEFLDIRNVDETDILKILTKEDLEVMCEYAVIKNILAGVGEVNIKTPLPNTAIKYIDEYNLKGKEVLSANIIDSLSAGDLVGDRIIIEVESLLNYTESYLSHIVDFCATTETPVLIKLGQSLYEVGKVVSQFNHSPAEVLEEYGFLDRSCYLLGMNFIDKEDQKLLKKYSPTLILTPIDDAEEGRGAINLYNLNFNTLKFVFSSGKCYNVDMFAEGRLAIYNTSNLMYDGRLVDAESVLQSLQSDNGNLQVDYESDCRKATILDKKIVVEDAKLQTKLLNLREKIKQIANKIKEKI